MSDTGEQHEPIMSGSTSATDEEKARGVIEQTASDFAGHDEETVLEVLTQRFKDSEIDYDEDTLRREAQRIAGSTGS